MITAVDSSVLLAIFNAESEGERWLNALIQARREGRLILCEIVYAEIAPAFDERGLLDQRLASMGISLVPINSASAWQAGITFRRYRKEGGPRDYMIPDFIIAAHGLCQADRLAAIDRGYLRRWFEDLPLMAR